MLQVAAGDGFPFRVSGKPSAAVAKKLFNFVLSDPVMFIVVQYRNENIEMRQEIAQAYLRTEFDREVSALAPFREFFIKDPARGFNGIAERLEEATQKNLAAAAGQGRKLCL